jgi:hypothetical protein
MFSGGSSRDIIIETRLEVSSIGRKLPFREDLGTEEEQWPLLEAVTRKRLAEIVIY